jgi:hypothetical protein
MTQAWVKDQRRSIKKLQRKVRIGEMVGKRVVPTFMMIFFIMYFLVCVYVYR